MGTATQQVPHTPETSSPRVGVGHVVEGWTPQHGGVPKKTGNLNKNTHTHMVYTGQDSKRHGLRSLASRCYGEGDQVRRGVEHCRDRLTVGSQTSMENICRFRLVENLMCKYHKQTLLKLLPEKECLFG